MKNSGRINDDELEVNHTLNKIKSEISNDMYKTYTKMVTNMNKDDPF